MLHIPSFSGAAEAVAGHVNVVGIAVGVFFNGMGVPGLGEVLLPIGGIAVREGKLNLVVLLAVALVSQLFGLMVAYAIARFGGVALVERYGKYVLISHRDLQSAHRAAQKYGTPLVVIGAFVPGIQGFIGYAAGLAEMNPRQFLLAAALGKLVWIGGLVTLGMALGNHLALIDSSIKQVGLIVLLGLIAFIVWHVLRHRHGGSMDQPNHGEEN